MICGIMEITEKWVVANWNIPHHCGLMRKPWWQSNKVLVMSMD